MASRGGTFISYDIEPFTKYGGIATDSAYPHADSPLPLNIYFAWLTSTEDDFWYGLLEECVAALKSVAVSEGIYRDTFTRYPNYAIAGTTAEELYGNQNAARLREIRDEIDPDRVMDLAGGFKI